MKARRILRGEKLTAGTVLTRDVGAFRKGRILAAADLAALEGAGWAELDVLQLEADDVHEDAAGRRLADAVAGEGVSRGEIDGGSFPLVAQRRGLVALDAGRLAQINLIPDLAAYAHPRGYVAVEGEVVGRVKVVPFVTREDRLRRAEEIGRGGLLAVRPFLRAPGALLVHEKIADAALEKARRSFDEKLAFFGSRLATARAVEGTPEALAAAIREEHRNGARLLVLAGSRSMDPQDPVLRALELAGARLERHGVPAYPGTLLWLAYLGDVPLVGAPSCGIFSRATSLDMLLPRLMAGDHMGARELAELSEGGLISAQTSWRLAPYKQGAPRGQLE
ncbi:MAG TPA: hypothetical protein VFA79_09310 [Myxococcales bacterium]|nr:hypothetical protein [Myxococcales bacterium]